MRGGHSDNQAIGRDSERERPHKPFAESHSSGMKLPCWREGMHWDKTSKGLQYYILYNGTFTFLSSPSASLSLQHSTFVSVIHVNDHYRGLRPL